MLESIAIVFANSITIHIFSSQRRTLRHTCYVVINLALADLSVGLSSGLFWSGEPGLKLYWRKAHRNRMSNCRLHLRKCFYCVPSCYFFRANACRFLASTSSHY